MSLIGIDIGGTKILVASCDLQGAIRFRKRISTPQDPGEALKAIDALVQAAASSATAAAASQDNDCGISGIGIACGGPLDAQALTVSPLHLPRWRNLALGAHLHEKFNCPVRLENDADAGAFAEYHVALSQVSRLLYVTLSTGLGGGQLLDGELYRGSGYSHPEIGHQSVRFQDLMPAAPESVNCACGAADCLEALISGTAIRQHFGKSADKLNTAEWLAVGTLLGRGLRNICVTFCPELIVLGGGVAVGGADLLLEPARQELARNLHIVPRPRLEISRLDYDAALWGALALSANAAGLAGSILTRNFKADGKPGLLAGS